MKEGRIVVIAGLLIILAVFGVSYYGDIMKKRPHWAASFNHIITSISDYLDATR